MKKLLFIYITLIFYSLPTWSQEEVKPCSANDMMDELIIQHPELEDSILQSEAIQSAFRKEFSKSFDQKSDSPYIIPVVFHVIHNNGTENISATQIENAILNMNLDFSAQTSGLHLVHSEFVDRIANAGIQFALAKRDPDGNCTNGIVRTVSNTTYAGGENLKEISPIWDRSKYLNIWVCRKIENGSAGYSRYPSSVSSSFGAAIDGIVVRYDYVGAIGAASSNAIHTLTHEAGHWLDLPHTWGSTNDPGLESNCNTDDGVEDTPNTIGWTVCNLSGESCGSLDNVQNFMEYSYCSRMFTQGQAERMWAALNSPVAERNNLWTSENLIATGVLEEDKPCKADFDADKRVICIGDQVTFQDYSYNGITDRTWIFEGGYPAVQQGVNPVVTYETPGVFGVTLAAGDDINTVSTYKTQFIRVLDTAYVETSYTEGFEEISSFDNGVSQKWFTESSGNNPHWEVTTDASYSGNKSMRVQGLDAERGEISTIYSQTFEMSAFDSTNAHLSLRYSAKRRNANSDDKLRILVSRNCGLDWLMRKELKGSSLYTVSGNQSTPFIPQGPDDWEELVITNIAPVFFTSEFRIKIELETWRGNSVYIDDINLFNPLTVDAPEVLKLKDAVTIFPNPTTGTSQIQMSLIRDLDHLEIGLYDIAGRKIQEIYRAKMRQGAHELYIHAQDLPGGIYFVKFDTSQGSFTEKLILSK